MDSDSKGQIGTFFLNNHLVCHHYMHSQTCGSALYNFQHASYKIGNDFKEQENLKTNKKSTSASLTMLKPLTVWILRNWKILKEIGYETTVSASWETCMQVKKQQLELDMKQQTGSKLGKEYIKAVYCQLSPCLFNLYAEYIMWNARMYEAQAGIKISRRNINSLRFADDMILMTES